MSRDIGDNPATEPPMTHPEDKAPPPKPPWKQPPTTCPTEKRGGQIPPRAYVDRIKELYVAADETSEGYVQRVRLDPDDPVIVRLLAALEDNE